MLQHQLSLILEDLVKELNELLTFPRPPHKSVTHKIMTCLLNIIEEKNIPFVFLTSDQPVYTLIVQFRNKNKEKFNKIIPIFRPFHTQVTFITANTKQFEGSGLSDTFISASIIADKSVDQAMCKKHFGRIVQALQPTYKALQQRIIRKSLDKEIKCPKYLHDKIDELRTQNVDMFTIYSSTKQDPNFLDFLKNAMPVLESTPLAEYWLSFMYMLEILIMNIHSIKLGNLEHLKDSLRLMIPWLQIYNKIHYGKWLPNFWSHISNLGEEIDQFLPTLSLVSPIHHF